MGVNAGNNVYKMGFLCLIGIAHLPETLSRLRYYHDFEIRPCLTTNLSSMIDENLRETPKQAIPIILNLFHAVKLICSKILDQVPIAGNIQCANGFLDNGMTGYPDEEGEDMVIDHLVPPMKVDDGKDPTA